MKKILAYLICMSLMIQTGIIQVCADDFELDWPIAFEENFDTLSMWTMQSNNYSIANGAARKPITGTAYSDADFAQARLESFKTTGNYSAEFRMRIDEKAPDSSSGIMFGVNGNTNFSLLLSKTSMRYLQYSQGYLSLAQLAELPERYKNHFGKWIDIKLTVLEKTPYVYVKFPEEKVWAELDIRATRDVIVEPGTISLRSQKGVVDYDFLKIYAEEGNYTYQEPAIDDITLSTKGREYYVGDADYLQATIKSSASKGYRVFWEVEPKGIIEISGTLPNARTITAIKPGKAKLTVKAGDKKAVAEFTVVGDFVPETKSATFQVSGAAREMVKSAYGGHQELCWHYATKTTENMVAPSYIEKCEEIEVKGIRGPGGIDAMNYVMKKNGTVGLNEKYYPYKDSLTPEAVIKLANELNVPYIYDMNIMVEQTTQDMVDVVRTLTKIYTGPELRIELGNEIYDRRAQYPQGDSYIAQVKEISKAIKAEFPDIKIGVCVLGSDLEKRITSDPNNFAKDATVDPTTTNGYHYGKWNGFVAEGLEYFDAICPHLYMNYDSAYGITQDIFMRWGYGYNRDVYEGYFEQLRDYFPGKEIWVTEWGTTPFYNIWMTDPGEKARTQNAKTPGFALLNMERQLDMLASGVVTFGSYHALMDAQCFGIWDDAYHKLPNYYVFKEIGKLTTENDFYYAFDSKNVESEWMNLKLSNVKQKTEVKDAKVWGFGDEEDVRYAVISNSLPDNMNISLDGYKLKQTWLYGGRDKVLPDFYNNPLPSYGDFNPDAVSYPDTTEGEWTDMVSLPGYSMMIVKLENNEKCEITENVGGKIMLKINSPKAVVGGKIRNIDHADNTIVPILENGVTMLPMRFLSESNGCYVTWNGEEQKVSVISPDNNVIELVIGSKKYTFNGEVRELIEVPFTRNDRTYLPLRAIAEIIGKDVEWNDAGVIVVSNEDYSLDDNTANVISATLN